MSDFKSYNQGRKAKQAQENGKQASDEKRTPTGQGDAQTAANLTAEIVKAFYGKSQKDVWQTILAQAEEGKRAGTLTNDDLDNFYNTVYPLVDGVKRKKLKSIIEKLKEI
ncbi:MAG: hypothetical protein ACI4MN_01750 [Candidatus Coproplasma sp.]